MKEYAGNRLFSLDNPERHRGIRVENLWFFVHVCSGFGVKRKKASPGMGLAFLSWEMGRLFA